jgi:hypothetical protein
LRGTKTGYDVSFQINASQLGVASYVQYWHFDENERNAAVKTFEELKKQSNSLVKQVEYEKIPFANVGPMTRAALKHIDVDHKEKSGVLLFNKALQEETAADWRQTLYGNRYPGHMIVNQLDKSVNSENSKDIRSTGSGRNKKYSLVINKDRL